MLGFGLRSSFSNLRGGALISSSSWSQNILLFLNVRLIMYYISGVFLKKVKDIRERKKKLNCGQKLCLIVFYTVIYNSCL